MKISHYKTTATLMQITDWNSLGAVIGVKPNVMAYALKSRDTMQHRITLGSRTVYRSDPILRFVQSRLITLFDPLFTQQPDTECAIAYRRGITAINVMRSVPHAKMIISFDIKHYYDNIDIWHLTSGLIACGMDFAGAKLAARYCLVKNSKGKYSLQQGSPASPVLSNIVGYVFFDNPIRNWLKKNYPKLSVTYLRYCDNVALFVHGNAEGEIPEDFREKYKSFVKEELSRVCFKTHKWAAVSDDNPVLHQKFLGMVINAEARAELDTVNRLRAMLFNWCRFGLDSVTETFMEKYSLQPPRNVHCEALIAAKFSKHLRGHINYIKRLNKKQGLMLEKLFTAAEYLDNNNRRQADGRCLEAATLVAVKQYRRHDESIDQYMARIANAA